MKFSSFVITYERHDLLLDTIDKIFSQTFSPEEILILDNSHSNKTKDLIQSIRNPKITYHRMGYNAGPAGAAKMGLKLLYEKGYDWIYWGDDDDPPRSNEIFENLFSIINERDSSEIGAVGSVGGFFDKSTGSLKTIRNKHITSDVIEVDSIPGGHNFIVNCRLVNSLKIFPTPKLFYGFEELDFCLKMKKANLKLLIDGKSILESRIKRGLESPNYKWKGKSFGDSTLFNRNYYSIRNMSYILVKNNCFTALAYNLLKNILKTIVGFKYGAKYGIKNARIIILAHKDFILGNYGKKDLNER